MELNFIIDEIGWIRYHYFVFIVCGCSWMSDLVWQSSMSIILDNAGEEWALSSFTKGLMSTIFMTGMVIGSYFWGYIADKKGRVFALRRIPIPILLGGILGFLSPSRWVLTASLFIVGLGAGGEVSVSTAIYTEYCPSSKKWTLVLLGLCWSLGAMLAPGIATALDSGDTHGIPVWRCITLINVLMTVPMLISRLFIMETPCFLYSKQKFEQCKQILSQLKEGSYELLEENSLETETVAISYLFRKEWIRLTLVFCVLYFGASLGSGGVFFFMPELIKTLEPDYSDKTVYLILFLQHFASVPGVFLTSCLVNSKLGRKWTMNIGFLMCGVFLVLFLGSVKIEILVTASSFYIMFAYIGYCAMYEILPETYPTVARSTAMGLGNAQNKIGGIVSPLVFGVMLEYHGGFYYALALSIISFFTIGFLGFLTNETKIQMNENWNIELENEKLTE